MAKRLISICHHREHTDKMLLWQAVIHIVFVLLALGVTYTDRLIAPPTKPNH